MTRAYRFRGPIVLLSAVCSWAPPPGETLAQVTAEAANPKGDVWFGGTGAPHLAAAEQSGFKTALIRP